MLHAEKYRNEDLAMMPPREQERDILELEAQLAEWRMAGPGFTIWGGRYGTEPIGAGGIIMVRTGVGEAWLRGTPRLEENRIAFARHARRLFEKVIGESRLWRIQALTRCDLEENIRFAQWFGFELEGRLAQHFPDRSDAFIWGRIR
jgi:hypothetical protein